MLTSARRPPRTTASWILTPLFVGTSFMAGCTATRGMSEGCSAPTVIAERSTSNAVIAAEGAADRAAASAALALEALVRLELAAPVQVLLEDKIDLLDTEKGTLTRRFCRGPTVTVPLV